MKQLSTEEKARRYDEALERARELSKSISGAQYGTIFPELKEESEDEKIRKELIRFVKGYFPNETSEQRKAYLAWLEKQGKHKSVDDLSPQEAMDIAVEKCFEQGEQNHVDEVEPFDKFEGLTDFERTLADICIGWIGEELGWKQYIKDNADVLLKIAVKMFNSVQDAPFEQNPAWSEEDERIVTELIGIFESAVDGGHVTFPYRLLKDYIRVLKLCLPQSQWKPSDEQMKQLGWIAKQNKDNMIGKELMTLYNDLKKLT